MAFVQIVKANGVTKSSTTKRPTTLRRETHGR
jgi:hypothetical protein